MQRGRTLDAGRGARLQRHARRRATGSRWSTSEARAREVTDYRARQKRDKAAARQTGMRGSLEQMMAQLKTAGRKEFPLIIKGDVQGSLEAIVGALDKLGTDEVGGAHDPLRRRRHHRSPT